MDENEERDGNADATQAGDIPKSDEAIGMEPPTESKSLDSATNPFLNGEIRTLDGEVAGDEFLADAHNYQVLLGKIDTLLEKLKLDA